MIYLKTELENGKEININVYGDEFYCKCPICGKEVHLNDEDLKHIVNDGCDFAGTSVYCSDCTKIRCVELKFVESTRENSNVLTDLFDSIKDEQLQKELYNALDTYNQLLYNDISDRE